jgi:hypothetical protein
MAKVKTKLYQLAKIISEKAEEDKEFAEKIQAVFSTAEPRGKRTAKKTVKRNPPTINPFQVLSSGGKSQLLASLMSLTIEELRDVAFHYELGARNVVLKWKNKERLVEFIGDLTEQRAEKGDAFRSSSQ